MDRDKVMGRRQQEWKVVKTCEDEATGLAVQVSMLPLYHPKYNLTVCQRRQDGSYSRFFAPNVRVEHAKAVTAYTGMVLARLFDEATLFVNDQVQAHADEEIFNRQIREERQIERQLGKDTVPHTGKTEREAGKRARHENNLAARRAADQERTHRTKGKSG